MKRIIKIIKDRTKYDEDKIAEIYEILFNHFYSNPGSLSQNEKNFFYINNLSMEVNNGGFDQFFLNPSGNYTIETLQALELIGENNTAKLLKEAMAEFPRSEIPRNRDDRIDILEKISQKSQEKWDKLDKQFYACEHNISDLLISFVTKNINDFNH